ncbi:MAG TPA: TIGR00341 family protein, partial [Candidatus Nanoarchaeia archaeon]|nr:TIGR00341 family protein [Candidatus Nanoarchaeia archaeon]
RVQQAFKDRKILDMWQERFSKDLIHIKILLPTEETEEVLDLLEKHISMVDGYRILLLHVEASLPRPEPPKKEITKESQPEQKTNSKKSRISREELYVDIDASIKLSKIFIILALLSSVVAAVGILQDNVAVIIGAMVIAPLLGPNLALSLATTLGDIDLARRAMKANAAGILAVLSFAALIGYLFKFDPAIPQIISRSKVGLGDIILALAAGSAATLSMTTGVSSALIGVMVAVALLPPLVVLGMLLGSGNWVLATGAGMLVLVNLICINLAGVMTFWIQGIQPRKLWEAGRATKATKVAMMLWTLLLIALVLILFSQRV